MEDRQQTWQIWIDTGGTFTDCIALNPKGEMLRTKVLSSSKLRGALKKRIAPGLFEFNHRWPIDEDIFQGFTFTLLKEYAQQTIVEYIDFTKGQIKLNQDFSLGVSRAFEISTGEEAPVLAARIITHTALNQSFPPIQMRLGSTKGTNALLEKKGGKVALLITKGFKDLMHIGNQQRPYLFQLDIPDPVILYNSIFEVEARMDASGQVIQQLNEAEIKRLINLLKAENVEAVAISLMHSYLNPIHEEKLSNALTEAGFEHVSYSEILSPSIKYLPRTQTTLVNAYLSPVLQEYLDKVYSSVTTSTKAYQNTLLVMSSAGGLVTAQHYKPKDSLLSGPAGGVVGAVMIARQMGFEKILTLDMGGTSTDSARYDGQYDYQYITKIAGVELLSPSLSIETVAAGGGSICGFDGHRLFVGPESAGAMPGPACYGAGGPLSITDVNLLLGKLEPSSMGIPIIMADALSALKGLQQLIEGRTKMHYSIEELLKGFEKIANEKMADAIRKISVAKGFDPENYALLAFGGAGGLHACGVAELLKIDTVLLPYDGGLLSAYGIGQARVERMVEQQVLRLHSEVASQLPEMMQSMSEKATALLEKEGFSKGEIEWLGGMLYLRFKGQESCLEINYEKDLDVESVFKSRYEMLFGHFPEGLDIEIESAKVIMATRSNEVAVSAKNAERYSPNPDAWHEAAISGQKIALYRWDNLQAGAYIAGPSVLLNKTSTTYIAQGWELEIVKGDNALMRHVHKNKEQVEELKEAIALELFTNRFSAIAEEMGAQLQRTAFSVNIKERLDFSCAILDSDAELLVNAPHIPVHLGSLGICARLVKEKIDIKPGDVIITNHPKYGGSHLPDVTLLMGVYTADNELIGYVINRAHHAEIGGKRPGSMPPDAQRLEEEGVVIVPTYLVRENKLQWKAIRDLLANARYPSRTPEENIADINAALAALRSGAEALKQLVEKEGLEQVHYYMRALKQTTHQTLQKALEKLGNGQYTAVEKLDDGHQIHLDIAIEKGKVLLDFAGTSPVHPFNLNANLSIVFSAVLYVLRLLCDETIPLNEGLMKNVEIKLPTSFLNPDFEDEGNLCPAVVGGNTEVSQRLVDTLIKALGLAACSQGTMNNFLFGNKHFGYYETICGGVGAGEGFHGRSAVHQHMTNTRITDPEELEFRFPVRLQAFSIRRNSGGDGKWKGGDGIIRAIEFLDQMDITILSQHRVEAPYGLHGGEAGKTGRQYIIRSNGAIEPLDGLDSAQVSAGDKVIIETPGGGGWGAV